MAYDTNLEQRIDGLTQKLGRVAKKKMFGGIGYLVSGNMCFGIHKDSLVLRTSAERADALLTKEHTAPFNITGRPMKGWLLISPTALTTEDQLLGMLRLGYDFARGLAKDKR